MRHHVIDAISRESKQRTKWNIRWRKKLWVSWCTSSCTPPEPRLRIFPMFTEKKLYELYHEQQNNIPNFCNTSHDNITFILETLSSFMLELLWLRQKKHTGRRSNRNYYKRQQHLRIKELPHNYKNEVLDGGFVFHNYWVKANTKYILHTEILVLLFIVQFVVL
jgi:hypothetical protein